MTIWIVSLIICLLLGFTSLLALNDFNVKDITYGEAIVYTVISFVPILNTILALFALGFGGVYFLFTYFYNFYINSKFMNKHIFKDKEK